MPHLARFLINLIWLAAAGGVRYVIGLILAKDLTMPAWADLEHVTLNREWQELRLYFRDGRMARVSTYFNHLPDVVAFTQARIKENDDARTARG